MADKSKASKAEYVTAADGHTYHKSATANATEAPTNEHTIKNATKSAGLTQAESEFVTILDYEWNLNGGANFDLAHIKDEYGYTDDEFDDLIGSSRVVAAASERGIPAKRINAKLAPVGDAPRAKLTPIQVIAANAWMDLNDTRSNKKKLQDLGVTTYQFNAWLRDENFKNYLKDRAEGLIGDMQHEAMLALADRVSSGDMKAIEYYHELTGRFVRERSTPSGGANSHDLQGMIIRIIEIIVDEVKDQETALRISDRLKGLVTGAQIAGVLPSPTGEVVTPKIAAARELTPEVEALMARGVGYNE